MALKIHSPEIFEAHKERSPQQLLFIAKLMGCNTIAEAEERNWLMSEIEDNVPPPAAEAPKRRGRKPGTKNAATKAVSQAEGLQTALAFVSPVVSNVAEYSQFVSLRGNMAIVINGQMSAGYPIAEVLTVCPHLDKLKAALAKCGKSLDITETDAGRLSIKGEKLRALVPCWIEAMPPAEPDAKTLEGNFDILKEAFAVCGTLASEEADRVIEASLLLEANTCTGTNGHALLQFWHGIANLPAGTVLPKLFATAVAAAKLPITGIGGAWNGEFLTSFTVWFENGAWIKTQCYNDRWKSLGFLDVVTAPVKTPVELFEAIDAVIPFIDEEKSNTIYFMKGFVQSHKEVGCGAQYEVPHLPEGKMFNGKLLKQVAPYVTTIDLLSYPDRAMFFGGTLANPIRGAVMCMIPN